MEGLSEFVFRACWVGKHFPFNQLMVVVHGQLTFSLIQWLHTIKNLDLLCLGMMVTQQVLSNKLLACH